MVNWQTVKGAFASLVRRIRTLPYRAGFARALVVLEGLVTLVPFLLSWWVSATYRSILAGWATSGMTRLEKRKALRQLMGEGDTDDAS